MIEIERGHVFDLATHDGNIQRIQFPKTLPKGDPSNHDGSLNQEFTRALISRTIELNTQKPSHYTLDIIEHYREALILHEVRAFHETLKKCYSITGLHVEQLPVRPNGHFYDPRKL